jgi:hypothetical protein
LPRRERGFFAQKKLATMSAAQLKPRAETAEESAGRKRPVYALALSRLAGIKLFDIKCAWFNENEYCEFFPRTPLSRGRRNRAG